MNETTNVGKAGKPCFNIASIICTGLGGMLSADALYRTATILHYAICYNMPINRESFARPAAEFTVGMACTGLAAIL